MTENMKKHIRINELLPYTAGRKFIKFFDLNSDEMLDEKIEVLEAVKAGKKISEIPNYYKVLELMPQDGIWD